MCGEITITVPKWDYFQTKSERERTPYWFRVNKDMMNSAGLVGLSAAQKWVWVCILGLCCSQNSKTIKFRPKRLAALAGVDESTVLDALEILEENGTTQNKIECTQNKIESTQPTIQNNTIQNNTTTLTQQQTKKLSAIASNNCVPQDLFNSWLETYKDKDWIDLEIGKAKAWLIANPKKAPKKDFTRFFNNWISTGWERYRKTLSPKKEKTVWKELET